MRERDERKFDPIFVKNLQAMLAEAADAEIWRGFKKMFAEKWLPPNE